MKHKFQILAKPSDEEFVITEEDPIYPHLMKDYLDENGKIRVNWFEKGDDGKYRLKKKI